MVIIPENVYSQMQAAFYLLAWVTVALGLVEITVPADQLWRLLL